VEDWELAIKLRKELGIDEVWNAGEFLCLDDNGVPYLDVWYKIRKGDELIEKTYKYVDNEWKEVQP